MRRTTPEAAKRGLSKMRLRIARANGPGEHWDIKEGAGRLQDIEMIAQLGHLLDGGKARDVVSGLNSIVKTGVLSRAQGIQIKKTYKLLWRLRVATQLLGQDGFEKDQIAETWNGAEEIL